MRRQLKHSEAEQVDAQEERERRELEEARQARERLQALSQEEQGKHPQGDTRSAAELVNEGRGTRE